MIRFNEAYASVYSGKVDFWRNYGIHLDRFSANPYNYIKAHIYIILASILVWVTFPNKKVLPNHLTVLYVLVGPISVVLYYFLGDHVLILVLVNFVFVKGALDWADGSLARLRGQTSLLGDWLDRFGALVNSWAFFLFLLLFLIYGNAITWEMLSIFLMIYIFARALDFREFGSLRGISGKTCSAQVIYTGGAIASQIKGWLSFVIDDRARTLDSFALIVLMTHLDVLTAEILVCLVVFQIMIFAMRNVAGVYSVIRSL